MLVAALGSTSTSNSNSNHRGKIAKHIEKHVFNWTILRFCRRKMMAFWEHRTFRHTYTMRVANVSCFLRHNPKIVDDLLTKVLSPKNLVFDPPWALKPELWQLAFEKAAFNSLRREHAVVVAAGDSVLQCSRCKSRKIAYTEMQTRSADEPSTVFAFCTHCHKRWKQ